MSIFDVSEPVRRGDPEDGPMCRTCGVYGHSADCPVAAAEEEAYWNSPAGQQELDELEDIDPWTGEEPVDRLRAGR